MSVVVTYELEAKEGEIEKMKQLLVEILPDTRAFAGCNSVIAYVDQDSRNITYMIEDWDSRADYEKYTAWRIEVNSAEKFAPFVAGPPTIRYFDKFDG